MGNRLRTKKIESILDAAKNHRSFKLVFTLFLCALAGCSQAPKTSEKQVAETFKQAMNFRPSGEPLTKIGSNESPSWSPDSQHFLFVSKNRDSHKNAQIYEWDLNSNKERRITFSDGDAFDAIYVSDGEQILYASTTDELKERPLLIKKISSPTVKKLLPSDLYLSRLNGLDITRITNHPGYDGQIHLSLRNKDEIYFTAASNGIRTIFRMDFNSPKAVSVFNDTNSERFDFVHMNGKFAWLESASGKTKLMFAENSLRQTKNIDFGETVFKDLSWVSGDKKGEEKLLATATFPQEKTLTPNSQIVLYDPIKACLSVVAQAEKSELTQGALSPDKKKLLYVSNEFNGTPQVLMKHMDWDHLNCDRRPEDHPKDR